VFLECFAARSPEATPSRLEKTMVPCIRWRAAALPLWWFCCWDATMPKAVVQPD
jgi:hypothetical protein